MTVYASADRREGEGAAAAARPCFSLVLATVGRTGEVERFLQSLDRQEGAAVELIVVDQNNDDRLTPLLEARKNSYQIRHIRTDRRGLSRARNLGLRHVAGDLVTFPDDDCWYPDRLLQSVGQHLAENPFWDGMTCLCRDATGAISSGRFARDEGLVTRLGAWGQGIETAMFFRRRVIDMVGTFDEELGLGARTRFGSGEGTDYLLRAIARNLSIYYQPGLFVHHPQASSSYDSGTIRRARSYGAGMGRILRKHRYPLWFKLRMLARPLGGALLSLASLRYRKSCYYLSVFLGRLEGLLATAAAPRHLDRAGSCRLGSASHSSGSDAG